MSVQTTSVRLIHSPAFLCLLLALATTSIYLPIARHDFVGYDDPDYVTNNPHVLTGLKSDNIIWAFATSHGANWHPMTWISHMLDCQLFGPKPGPQHLVGLVFHVANTILLLLVLRGLTGAVWRSAFVAALFALHPLHVESVAWIAERKDLLSAFFFLLTVWSYSKYVECRLASVEGDRKTFLARRYYPLTLLFFALGLMSKAMVVTLPFVLLLLDFWPLGRMKWSFQPSPPKEARGMERAEGIRGWNGTGRIILEKVPFFILSLLSCWITFLAQHQGGAVQTSLSLNDRVANALVSYVRYLGKTVWPDNLAVLYPHPGHWPIWKIVLSAAFLLFIMCVVVVLRKEKPWLLTGWLWFVGMLVPVIGLIQVGVQSIADRYTYLPSIGLFIIVVWSACDLLAMGTARLSRARRATAESQRGALKTDAPYPAAALICAVLVTCAIVASHQLRYWQNSETLFSHATRVTYNNYVAYNNLGFTFMTQGKTSQAIENYRKALEINPSYEDALRNMGFALASSGKSGEAIPYYEAALRVGPQRFEVHYALGNLLAETGRLDEAMDHYRLLLSKEPDHVDARNNLGIALAMRGRLDDAIAQFREALRYKNDPNTHNNLGNVFLQQHKPNEAIKEYQESLRLNPNDPQTHYNLGIALTQLGLNAGALSQFQESLRLNPDQPEAHLNAGMILAKQGRKDEAAASFKEALRLKPDYTEAKEQLNALSAQHQ
jgi:tetratricopeptide (TPR) repeat protein